MTNANKPPEEDDSGQPDKKKPDPGPTKRLDKAVEELGSGDTHDGTLVDISAGTGEHPQPPRGDDSVSSELKRQKGAGGSQTPDIEPAATMYEPTERGNVTGGSHDATMYEPTGTDQHRRPPSEQVQTPSGSGRPVAPFGGKIMVGTKIGQIEITGVLGKGGMGEVFKGYHQALDIDVALKVLPDELSRNELVRQRFLREARLCVKLDHPHIVRVYNVDEYAGNLYLVMEMIEGTDSAAMLKDGGRFRYKRALEIGAACADALSYAHTQGLVHRDVKPHNILLGARDAKIKLSDFGLARAATSSSHLTMSGQIMGTPHYMSPEQAESKEVTDKSDVYSLGVTLYHMLTGETPFVGDTPISVAVQHIAKEIIYPEIRFKPFPKELVAVLKRMTAKDPAKRCSAKQAAVWLRKLISMATDDDIKVDDDQAMKSMAPVVRESEAFQMAQKERLQRDHQAREAAQTMLATVQEQSGRRQSVTPEGHDTGGQAYQTQPQAKGAGGKIAAAVIVLLLLGGGAAGWYFLYGPGAAMPGDNGTSLAGAGGNSNERENSNVNGTNEGTGGDNGNGTDNNEVNGGGDTDNNDPTPELVDDPMVASRLKNADEGITNANSLEEILAAGRSLELADMESDAASESQLKELADLKAKWERQFAYFEVEDAAARSEEALREFEAARGNDREAAIASLNVAIAQRTRMNELNVPPRAAELVESRRTEVIRNVSAAVDDFWTELSDEVENLIKGDVRDEKRFEQAEDVVTELESIDASEPRVIEVAELRARVETLAQHELILARLDSGQLNEAKDRLNELNKAGVPEVLKEEHNRVSQRVADRFDEVFQQHINAAREALSINDFDSARDNLSHANDLDLEPRPAAIAADLVLEVKIRERLHNARTAFNGGDFGNAKELLAEADELIRNPDERKIPETLPGRHRDAVDEFDAALARRFNELMAAAKSNMQEKDFSSAGKNLQDADELPLTSEQKVELDKFREKNSASLTEYVRELIDDLREALDEGRFEDAGRTVDTIHSLKTPADMKEELSLLESRFTSEAADHHDKLLGTVGTALDDRRYPDARKSLDEVSRIPVDEDRKARAQRLESRYREMLGADVKKLLANADEYLQNQEFANAAREAKEARSLLAGSDDKELTSRAKTKLESVTTAFEARFEQLLQDAAKAREAKLLESSDELLKEAEELVKQAGDVPVDKQDLLLSLSGARDEHMDAVDSYMEALFKQLEEHVRAGNVEEGQKVVEKIRALKPSATVQLKLKEMEQALTGETAKQRRERLPGHLKAYFRARTLSVEQYMDLDEGITSLNVSPSGEHAVVGTVSGRVHFYNLKRGTKIGGSTGGRDGLTAVAFAPDGSVAVSGNESGTLVRYTIEGVSVSANELGNAGEHVTGLAFSTNGNVLYVATYYGEILRFNVQTGARIGSMPSGLDRASCLAISTDGKWLAVGGDEGRVRLFNADSMVLNQTLKAPDDETIQRVAFNADSSQVVGGSIGDQVCRWGFRSEKPAQVYEGLDEWVAGVGFSEDGSRCAAFDNEYRLKVWKTDNGIEILDFPFEAKLKGSKEFRVSAGVIGPDGTVLIGTRQGELIHLKLKNAGE